MQVVDPIDYLDFDLFGRLTSDNMIYGSVQRARGQSMILASDDNTAENMVQGEYGTCYLLSVLQCQDHWVRSLRRSMHRLAAKRRWMLSLALEPSR